MAPDMIDEQDMAVESPAEDTMTRRLRQVYLVVLIACAIVEAGIMADVASGGQLRRDLEWQVERWKDHWDRERTFRREVGWMMFQAEKTVRESA